MDGVAAADSNPGMERVNPVHEAEGAEMLVHAVSWDIFTAQPAGRAGAVAVVPCCRITILQKVPVVNRRGMSTTRRGDLKRSGGTSFKNACKRSNPAGL